jgi:UDP-N-acetylmuramoyl-tripeptide--D-alanyl-D-alanine ligase
MIPLTAEEAGRALGLGTLDAPVTGVSIDSRSTRPGDLFIALRGERFDGHEFVAAAFAAGASAAVVESRGISGRDGTGVREAIPGGKQIYEVDDTLAALGAVAREVRRKSGAMVFAVTGSAGKTSTKDLLGAMVSRVRRTVTTAANQNNEVGVPLTLLSLEPDSEAVIVEMGMRGHGQISALTQVAEPDVGIITNIYPVHLELLGTLEDIAEAKAEVVAGLKPGGVAVCPSDCGVLRPFVAEAGRRVVSFGVGPAASEADVECALEPRGGGAGCELRLRFGESEVRVETSYLPKHTLENVAAAAAACYAAGLPVGECAEGISDVRFARGRGQVMALPGLCVIDDTYNANPAAVRAALDELVRLAAEKKGRAVAVLGDMLELGPESTRYHREAGAYAAEVGVRALGGVGPLAQEMVEGYRERLGDRTKIDSDWTAGHVDSSEETSSLVRGLRPGDVVLVKASRGVRLESMVSRIAEAAEAGAWIGVDPAKTTEDETEGTR